MNAENADTISPDLLDLAEIESIHETFVSASASLARDFDALGGNPRVQKFTQAANMAFDIARRSVRCANQALRDLHTIHRIVRIGNWRVVLEGRFTTWSDEMHELFGSDPRRFIPSYDALLQWLIPEDRTTFVNAFQSVIAGRMNVAIEVRAPGTDDSTRWFWIDLQPEHDESGTLFAVRGICQEITERKTALERIRYVSSHDPVTNLINRGHLIERLEPILAEARRRREEVALLCFDLDGFKGINELFGHMVGDLVLREVASRMTRHVRDSDIVARIGGDEFVVVQTGGQQPESSERLARRLLGAIAAPILFPDNREIVISASAGIAFHSCDDLPSDTLLARAGLALHTGRNQSRNSLAFYEASMESEWQTRRALEQNIRFALQYREFSLVFQPMFSMCTASYKGFEALLRWTSPIHGVVPPDLFVGIAESMGLMEDLGAWVLREACAEATRWSAPLTVAVNVSPIQIQQGNFATVVEDTLAKTGLAPERLELEVTESLLIRSPERAVETLRRIKALGVRIAIDDFGSGYSSLATLRAFPFDKLKVDRNFVHDLGEESESLAIIKAVIGLGRGLRLPVVVEGVETEQQAAILRDCGADVIQGYLVGRPLPILCFRQMTDPMRIFG